MIDLSLYCKFEVDQLVTLIGIYVYDLLFAGLYNRKIHSDATLEWSDTAEINQPAFKFSWMPIIYFENLYHIDPELYERKTE